MATSSGSCGIAGVRWQSCKRGQPVRGPTGLAAAQSHQATPIIRSPPTRSSPTLSGFGSLQDRTAKRSIASNAQKQQFSSFEDMIQNSELPLVVDFYATWCGPCQMLSNELAILSEIMKGEVSVVKIDTEKYPSISSRHYVQGLPTVILFYKGEEVHRMALYPSQSKVCQSSSPAQQQNPPPVTLQH